MKHKWHANLQKEAFDLLSRFVNILQPDESGQQTPSETKQLLARYSPLLPVIMHY